MMNKAHNLTPDGISELKAELELLYKRRIDISERLKAAKTLGDLSENADYSTALDEQKYVESRISKLEDILLNAKVVKKTKSTGQVVLGSEVHLQSEGKVVVYSVVDSLESDPAQGKISSDSPIGKALLGKKVGDSVEIAAPSGARIFKVTKIS